MDDILPPAPRDESAPEQITSASLFQRRVWITPEGRYLDWGPKFGWRYEDGVLSFYPVSDPPRASE